MARHGIRPVVLAICLPWLLIFGSNGAVGTELDVGGSEVAEGQAWRQQIAELEARLFDPLLPPTEVNRLLGQLEHADTRPEAARRLGQQGQGHIDQRSRYFSSSTLWEGLCPLPTLKSWPGQLLGHIATLPWWMKPHLPATYHASSRFIEPKPGESEPEVAPAGFSVASAFGDDAATPLPASLESREPPVPPVPLDPAAPAVVILPPRLSGQADPSAIAAAELACDRLAQEITAAGLASVVDRQQVDRLLMERELAEGQPEPMLSFDVMLRLEVDAAALAHTARLSLIDLSHGNPLSEAEYDWPLREADLPAMVEQCREAFKQVGQPKDDVLRVRYLGAQNPQRNLRIAPLVARLGQVFGQAVSRSPGLVLVHCLEAASAKEESLLLMMGLSRLPGGRQFVPQADATIELRVREGDGAGKTFEQTPVEITVDVAPAAGELQSLVIVGTAGEFDDAVARAWDKLAGVLREAEPAGAADWLSEMAVRRQQAEAELRAAREIASKDSGTDDMQARLAEVSHAEAALKLDPTYEDAAYHHLVALSRLHRATAYGSAPDRSDELADFVLTHAMRYFNRFDPETSRRSHVHSICVSTIWLSMGPLFATTNLHSTPQRLRTIRHAQWLLEHCLEHDGPYHADARALLGVGLAMRRAGIPEAEREAWVDSLLEQCVRFEAAFPDRGKTWRYHVQEGNLIWLRAAELAVEDGRMARAKTLIAERRPRFASGPEVACHIVFRHVRELLVKMDDAAELAEFERWVEAINVPYVRHMELPWPAIEVFPGERQWPRHATNPMPWVEGEWVRFMSQVYEGLFVPMSSLIEAGGHLYLVGGTGSSAWPHFRATAGEPQWRRLGYVSLNDTGEPIGELQYATRHGRNELWYVPTWLPPPETAGALHVLDAAYLAGRLILGTERKGLTVFDPKTEQWLNIAAEDGLPAETVVAVHPLDDQSLFCVGLMDQRVPVGYTVTLPEGTITLRHRLRGEGLGAAPRTLWRDGEALRAWTERGLYDDLLAEHPTFKQRGCGIPYGWNCPGGTVRYDQFTSFAEVDGRRFVTNAGLHEFDSKGTFLRSYRGTNSYWLPSEPGFRVSLPADAPIPSDQMVTAGDLLVFIDRDCVLGWDPRTDTWYGPLAVLPMHHFLGTRAGVWLGTSYGLMFLSADNLKATAKAAGRVLTTDQYRQRQREVVAAMPPLDRALVAFSVRRFDQAKELAQTVLEDDPECVEALLLLGYLHESWALNRPEVALEYYGRLAELTANPNASFTGMYRRLVFLRSQKRWPDVLATIEEITGQFPRLHETQQGTIDWWRNHAREQLGVANAKQPAAAETENRE